MSKGADALIEEIRARHYSAAENAKGTRKDVRTNKAKRVDAEPSHNDDSVGNDVPRARRRKTRHDAGIGVGAVSGAENLFDVTIVGGIGLPGYPLESGEKLAIVKLTPRA